MTTKQSSGNNLYLVQYPSGSSAYGIGTIDQAVQYRDLTGNLLTLEQDTEKVLRNSNAVIFIIKLKLDEQESIERQKDSAQK